LRENFFSPRKAIEMIWFKARHSRALLHFAKKPIALSTITCPNCSFNPKAPDSQKTAKLARGIECVSSFPFLAGLHGN
jgi:hypothetical protein